MARLTDQEVIDLVAYHDPSLSGIVARVLAERDARYAGLVNDVLRVLPRVALRNMTPDVAAALDRLRAAVRDIPRS